MVSQLVGQILGYTAGALLVTANGIQLFSSIKAKNVNGIVLPYLILFCVIPMIYTVAGLLDKIPYIYIANIISFIEVSTLVVLKLWWNKPTVQFVPMLDSATVIEFED